MTVPLLRDRGHQLAVPSPPELDLFDAEQVRRAIRDIKAVLHLATHIPTPDRRTLPGARDENDRLRDEATRLLVDGALSADTARIVMPTVAFVYPPGPADESTPLENVPDFLRSELAAENHLRRFNDAGRCGVVLCFGALHGPEAASPTPTDRYDVHLHTTDAASALVERRAPSEPASAHRQPRGEPSRWWPSRLQGCNDALEWPLRVHERIAASIQRTAAAATGVRRHSARPATALTQPMVTFTWKPSRSVKGQSGRSLPSSRLLQNGRKPPGHTRLAPRWSGGRYFNGGYGR